MRVIRLRAPRILFKLRQQERVATAVGGGQRRVSFASRAKSSRRWCIGSQISKLAAGNWTCRFRDVSSWRRAAAIASRHSACASRRHIRLAQLQPAGGRNRLRHHATIKSVRFPASALVWAASTPCPFGNKAIILHMSVCGYRQAPAAGITGGGAGAQVPVQNAPGTIICPRRKRPAASG